MTDEMNRKITFEDRLEPFKENVKCYFKHSYKNESGNEDPQEICLIRDGYRISLQAEEIINRQKAEIKRLKRKANTPFCQVTFDEEKLKEIANEYVENIEFDLNQLKSEVIKEFAERLKTNFNKNIRLYGRCTVYDATTEIDDLVKEMTEVQG